MKRLMLVLPVVAILAACSAEAAVPQVVEQPTPQIVYVTPAPVPQPTPKVVFVTPEPVAQPTPQVIEKRVEVPVADTRFTSLIDKAIDWCGDNTEIASAMTINAIYGPYEFDLADGPIYDSDTLDKDTIATACIGAYLIYRAPKIDPSIWDSAPTTGTSG